MNNGFHFSCTMMLAGPMNTALSSVCTRLCFPMATLYSLPLLHVDREEDLKQWCMWPQTSNVTFLDIKKQPLVDDQPCCLWLLIYVHVCVNVAVVDSVACHELLLGLHCFLPDAVSSGEDPLVGDQSASTGVSPFALSVVLEGNLQHTREHNQEFYLISLTGHGSDTLFPLFSRDNKTTNHEKITS